MKTFEELGVSEEIRRAIEELGFENPMPVQEEVIPYLLGNKNDVIALAQTGTGKTASYGIPVIQKTDASSKQTQAIILRLWLPSAVVLFWVWLVLIRAI